MLRTLHVATVVGVVLCALAAGATGVYAQATARPGLVSAMTETGHVQPTAKAVPAAAAATPRISLNFDGVFRIHSSANGRCLDADTNTLGGDGTKVQLWNCGDNTHTNQLWYVYESPDNVFEAFQNVASRQWLDADKNTIGGNGTKVQLWHDLPVANQLWLKNCGAYCRFATADPDGAARVLDADSKTLGGNGTKVQLWEDLGGPNQHWYFELVQAP